MQSTQGRFLASRLLRSRDHIGAGGGEVSIYDDNNDNN